MITGKKLVALVDIDSVLDPETGDRTKQVSRGRKIVQTVDLVGVNTAQLGQVQGFNLAFSVEVYRTHYDNEKYLYFDGNSYEIKSLSKASVASKMLLNVQRIDDAEIKSAIEEWL